MIAGSYYWRIRATDNNNLSSEYIRANEGNIAFIISSQPNLPSNLGPINLTNGSSTNDTTPSLTFEITDPELSEQIRYQVQISENSDFSVNILDFTSILTTQGAKSYTTQQELPTGNYYWRVRAYDQFGQVYDYVTANNGDIAFSVIAYPNLPNNFGPVDRVNGSVSNNTQPTFNFSLNDPDNLYTVRYRIQISSTNDFTSIVTDYTSTLNSQGNVSFTLGQDIFFGSYLVGSTGQ